MGVYIDEARGNNLVARINDRIGLYAGKVTKRVGALVARSPSSWPIVAHPLLLDVCAGALGRQLLYDLPGGAEAKSPAERFILREAINA